LAQSNWYLPYLCSRWPPKTLRGAIIKAANRERLHSARRYWWFWHRVRMRMVEFYAANYGAVPAILAQRNVPRERFALGRDVEFKKWWPGAG